MCATHITGSYWLTILLRLAILHLVHSQDITIDDRDPAIKYSAGWSPQSGNKEFYNGTSMLTGVAGSTAIYTFNGTRVSVFGRQGPGVNKTVSTYSINKSSPSSYTVPPDLVKIHYVIKFYSSPPLSEGEHTLTITNLNDQAAYWLDYFEVTPPETSDPKPTPTPTRGLSKGVITGVALGISALVVLLLLAALLWRRRHIKSTKLDSTADLLQPLEGGMMHDLALLEPYQVDQYASLSNVATSSNGLNEKRTLNAVAPIHTGHASDSASTPSQHTSEGREEIPPSEPSTLRPGSPSKLRPPYRGASSSRSTGNPPSSPGPQMPPSKPTPSSSLKISSRRSTDGGVRMAGGPPRTTREEELDEIVDAPTLPPAYGTY